MQKNERVWPGNATIIDQPMPLLVVNTVNLKFFARVYFRETLLRENKSSRNGEIFLSFTDIGKSCPSREF